ncbi:DUF1652 domain-containing protein [Pseudomonas typographi]|uniref:DUF1652 domain-containing protein n=1 Tax=Pseudomonas typographi TaxID=2715964 RepID=A0ABR7Z7T9_9PSED|nr:DUF1652 domain-containing protein [Pseudomonas typographi]MBD1554633.1 DUF1652 domain-containing protein [Pseudomonas typographi]MBD1587162.1 DUF1652 domain-containing protein [Pseudomonas typographi]MBD1601388.1 DUF1652 domain-containing protein [Pseudomonas typographi]
MVLELRRIMETAFLPYRCDCQLSMDGTMNVQLLDPHTGAVALVVSGISTVQLTNSRAIAALVAELKEEARLRHIVSRYGAANAP